MSFLARRSDMNSPQPSSGRPTEIEEITNRFLVHPLSRRLIPPLARLRVHPNVVSLCGLGAGLAAAECFHRAVAETSAAAATFGLAGMFVWHVLDGADGQLARLTGRASLTGKIVDGIADYGTWAAIYLALALALSPAVGHAAWLLVLLAAASHLAQAAAYQLQREEYMRWACGVERAGHREAADRADSGPGAASARPLIPRLLDRLYTCIQYLLDPTPPEVRAMLRHQSRTSGTRAALALSYRRQFAPILRSWNLLSANMHTLALYLFTAFGMPTGFLVFEMTAMNLLLLTLLLQTRRRAARLTAGLGAHAPSVGHQEL